MEAMRESWTDERLDDFRANVDRRFDEVNQHMDAGFTRVDGELRRINGRLDAINDRLDGMHRVMFQAAVALVVGLLGTMAALVGVIATQI
ncbi:MAG: hypothetical protein JJE35_05685 [Thermoleophilia bacterium]|nr:hypothetical protein [Thermoleophilia bacterium]